MLYILLTKYFCDIFSQRNSKKFDEIKDQIIYISFQNDAEKQKYIENIHAELEEYEEFDGYFLLLSEEDVFFVMDSSKENQNNIFRNVSHLSEN